ncbi:sugar kinase [Solirhodobacter olei]|uniref:sugar kinase n=1 Tax=Solirhodobacter olei TaxID=2493082 RepID=UPI000FDAF642|nr:sugar kinase [Solirhodobacter olei]
MSGARRVIAIGEAMVEMAPVGQGLYRRGFAGDTLNTAWHMAQLLGGEASVGFVSRVGQDSLSGGFLAEMRADGLDISGIGLDPERTMGLYLIDLMGVERRFHYWRSASAARALADDRAALETAAIGASLIHLSGITLAVLSPTARQTLLSVLHDARAAGARISFDPNIRPRLWSSPSEIRETVQGIMAVSDIVLPSFDDETMTWGDATPSATIERYRDHGVCEIVVKDGANPVHAFADGSELILATPEVSDACDTSGAGDAFNAGYLAARLLGYSVAPSLSAGQALSAEVIRTYGARAAKGRIPRLQRVPTP